MKGMKGIRAASGSLMEKPMQDLPHNAQEAQAERLCLDSDSGSLKQRRLAVKCSLSTPKPPPGFKRL
jgi:hypothetical protein